MSRRIALLISSALTVFVLVLGVGIALWLRAPGTDALAASPAEGTAATVAPAGGTRIAPSAAGAESAGRVVPSESRRRAAEGRDDAGRTSESREERRALERAESAPERDARGSPEPRASHHSHAGNDDG